MKFSMIFEAQLGVPSLENERQLFHDCVTQALAAEEYGYDRVWAVEHHALRWYAHMSAPEIFLTWVAAKTKRIRVGHGVVCLPFAYNHPIRVAERVATLDILSGGRVDMGVGRGATVQELGGFGIDPEQTLQQMLESIRMIPKMWRDEEFEWNGELLQVPPRPIIPKPVQDPHPPLYMACTRNETLELAAALGIGALAMGWAGPEEVRLKRKIYDDACAARDPNGIVGEVPTNWLSGMAPACIMADRDEARRIGLRGQRFFNDSIQHWYTGGPPPRIDTEDEDNAGYMQKQKEGVIAYLTEHGHQVPGLDLIRGDSGVQVASASEIKIGSEATGGFNPAQCYGNAGDAIEYVEQMVDAGADEVMFCFQMGTVPHEVSMEGIEIVGREVIPRFRDN
jgi:alkanesulfonate monooxygenase SsuD/methylene tetrahydromethanopterin reductase-like flavin-dependent oxidoreductase (luciferase family)